MWDSESHGLLPAQSVNCWQRITHPSKDEGKLTAGGEAAWRRGRLVAVRREEQSSQWTGHRCSG